MARNCTNLLDSQSSQDEGLSEDTPLIQRSRSLWSPSYHTRRKCVTSKAALLILLWSFLVGLLGGMLLDARLVDVTFSHSIDYNITRITLYIYIAVGFITCFFPLAGVLADIRFGRYKTIITSIYLVLISLLLLILSSVFWVLLVPNKQIEAICLFSVCGGISVIMLYTGLIGFTANVVQFGIDQLHDSPGDDRTLFIHWYVWTYYGSILIGQLGWDSVFSIDYYGPNSLIFGCSLLGLILLTLLTVLPITLCLVRRRRRWFLIEPGQYNPYKLVYRVTKFARQHKIPVRRSAFTYCEVEVPMGLDLGKEKYGGPFTTEQVEDVKAFYGILKVLFSFGVVFFLGFAADSALQYFDVSTLFSSPVLQILIHKGLLSPLLITICIPLYLCLLRPFFSRYVPGMLKRMGLGMILALLSLLATISMDLVEQLGYPSADSNSTDTTISMGTVGTDDNSTEDDHICMFNKNVDRFYPSHPSYHQNFNLFTIQLTLSALSRMLIYTGVFEFICSQSPHSMKGLIIGVFYAIRALYQVFSALLVLPYSYWGTFKPLMLSCEFYFYLMNTVIGLVAVLVYVWVAKRYRYRVRDELCNIRQYAEEYYSNPNQERFYDYD